MSAAAHLDFRITVLPSMGLSIQADGARITGSGGTLTLQRETVGAGSNQAPTASTQLQPRRRVVDTSMPMAGTAGNQLITIASP